MNIFINRRHGVTRHVMSTCFGSHLVRAVDGTDEECERELELERGREEEEQVEIPSMKAIGEVVGRPQCY